MSVLSMKSKRVLSGMRSTGTLHLGHLHGALSNWNKLQYEYECFFGVMDWHALTTDYESPGQMNQKVIDLATDWLSCGINPGSSHLFIQSLVPEHAELTLLLGMLTPMGWLERVPTYKEQQNNLREKDLSTYGFLGYPLMQAADILVYKADYVPVGEDQVVHVEFSREVARRFNYLYGRDANYLEKAEQALERMGKKNAKLYRRLQKAYQEQGCHESLERGQALVEAQGHLKLEERERLTGYLEGVGKILLPEPEALLTKNPKLPGLDGQKMSKSYHNTISLRDKPDVVDEKVRTMQTDPARIRLSDPGNPEKCPVWNLHQVYSSEDTKQWVQEGCRYAKIGCLDCKRPIIEAIQKELAPIQERAEPYIENPTLVKSILNEGSEAAREEAKETLIEVREVIGVDYR